MNKKRGSTFFDLGDGFRAECWSENTRYGFRHLCILDRDYTEISTAKACYYNRTWEAYDFQSVLRSAVDKIKDDIRPSEYEKLVYFIENKRVQEEDEAVNKMFGGLAAVSKMAAIMAPDEASKNASRRRVIEAGAPGVSFPDDWESVPEDEKTRRLDALEAEMSSGIIKA